MQISQQKKIARKLIVILNMKNMAYTICPNLLVVRNTEITQAHTPKIIAEAMQVLKIYLCQ